MNAINWKSLLAVLLLTVSLGLTACSKKEQTTGTNGAPAPAGPDGGTDESGYPRRLTLDLGEGISMRLALVPGTTFTMGSPAPAAANPDFDELQHEVSISKPFYMGAYQVTQAQYRQIMGRNPSEFLDPQNPVEHVSWDDAVEFCHLMSQRTGRRVTLPTEAQWELACRAGTKTRFSFGNNPADLYQYGNYCDQSNTDNLAWQDKERNDGADKTAKVGSYKPNAFGLYDMHGNVLEWCDDWYEQTYPTDITVDPAGPKTGMNKVLRGGHWKTAAAFCRSAYRVQSSPSVRSDIIGFRVVVAVEESDLNRATEVAETDIAPAGGGSVAASPNHSREMLIELGDNLYMRLVPIKAGTFQMGSPETESDRRADETQHEVTLSKPFLMGVTQVTQEQFQYLMDRSPSAFRGDAQNPVENVSWEDAVEFCKVMSEKTGKKVSLPTEAQWEYACRAGTTTPFNMPTLDADLANYDAKYAYGDGKPGENRRKTTPTAGFLANDFGLYDMHGNVQEWCADWYDKDYYEKPEARKDPTGPAEGSFRVVRGGSWRHGPIECRSASRDSSSPGYRDKYIGFRVVVEME